MKPLPEFPGIRVLAGRDLHDGAEFHFAMAAPGDEAGLRAFVEGLAPGQEVSATGHERPDEYYLGVRRTSQGLETRTSHHGSAGSWSSASLDEAVAFLRGTAAQLDGSRDDRQGYINVPGLRLAPSFAAAWRDWYAPMRQGYLNVLGWDLWKDWQGNDQPESQASYELASALLTAWGGDPEASRGYLARAQAICDRAAAEKPYAPVTDTGESIPPPFPRNRALMARVRAHVRGLLGAPQAHELAVQDFRAAAADYVEWCRDDTAGTWGEMSQAWTLDAVRLALLAGDAALAASTMKTRRRFRFHATEHAFLFDLAQGVRLPETRAAAAAFLDDLREPRVRKDPFRHGELVRLEAALLLGRLFDAPCAPLDWQRAVARVAE